LHSSVRQDIITCIDDPYSLEQLRSPRMNLSTVRPLVDKFYDMKDISISTVLVTIYFCWKRFKFY